MVNVNNDETYRMTVSFGNTEDMFIEENVGNIGFMVMRAKLQDIIDSVMQENNLDKLSVIVLYEICKNTYSDDFEYFDSDEFDVFASDYDDEEEKNNE